MAKEDLPPPAHNVGVDSGGWFLNPQQADVVRRRVIHDEGITYAFGPQPTHIVVDHRMMTPGAQIELRGGTPIVTINHVLREQAEATEQADATVTPRPSITIESIVIPERKTESGVLIASTSVVWNEIVKALGDDWSLAYRLTPTQWEELVAGAFKLDGYDDVTLTPRSGDLGRDVIAVKHGVGSVKILGSVKAYAPDRVVPYDAVRALMGVIGSERDTSKGIITTTSTFPPRIELDSLIAPLLPTRLEMVDGPNLQKWLASLSKS